MIPTTTRRSPTYIGTGAGPVPYAFSFKVLADSDVQVVTVGTDGTVSTLTGGYSVSRNADQENFPGGSVTVSIATGVQLVVIGARPYAQTTQFPSGGGYNATVLEQALDSQEMQIQQLLEQLARTAQLPASESGPCLLPALSQRASKFLAFDALGVPIATLGLGADAALRTDLGALNGVNLVNGAAKSAETPRVVDSIAGLRALLKTGSPRAIVTGYYAPRDGGGGVYCYDSADGISADNGGSIIVATDGGRWKIAQTFPLSIKQFGAKGDGVTDDRAAIQAAIDAAPTNGTIYIPPTNQTFYSVGKNPGGSYCLQVAKPVNIVGDGLYSAINPNATATVLVDTFNLTPNGGYGFWGMTWDFFTIGNPNTGTRKGRHGIFIDTQVAGSQLPKPMFRRLNIMQGDGTNANAICHLNNGANNVNGGMYCAEIVDCQTLKGGILLTASGDSNIIQRNIITGIGVGVSASLVSGASLLTIVDNNITTDGGQIRIDSGCRTKILNNNMEQQGPTTGQTVMVYLSGLNGTMTMCEIRGNHMGAFTGSNMTANVLIAPNVNGTVVENNTMLNSNAGFTGPCVTLTGGISNRIGFNQYGTNITTQVSDAGTGTIGVKKTITLLNSWVAQTGFPAPYYIRDADGYVHLHGTLANGVAAAGTVIATLPADARPTATQDFPTASAASGTYNVGVFNVNAASGNITIQAGSNGQFGLNGHYRSITGGVLAADV